MNPWCFWSAACVLTIPQVAMAQTKAQSPTNQPAPAKPAPSDQAANGQRPDTGDILIVAETGDRQAIDRKSYAVRQGPAAEIATGVDVMRDLPSVSMDAAGKIELLGNANVKILFDGRPVPDALSILRSMSASQIVRIEVITNPSAQFPADGTAGIINVITRRSSKDGVAGTVTAGVDSQGGGILRAAPSWSKGRWSLSTSPTLFLQHSPSEFSLERQQLAGVPDGVSNRTESGGGTQHVKGFGSRTQLVFRPDKKRSFAAALSTSAVGVINNMHDDVGATDGLFAPYRQIGRADGTYHALNLALDYRVEGDKAGDLFTVGATGTRFVLDNATLYRETPLAGGTSQSLGIDNRLGDSVGSIKVDYARSLGTSKRLSVGASFDWRRRTLDDSAGGRGLLTPLINQRTAFAGDYTEGAAYATFQTMIGSWKLLPGLRVQTRDYSLDDLNGGGPQRTDLFPSLFVEHKLSKRLTSVVSYSRRIAWPDIDDLSPLLRLQTPTSALQGNPALRPETTDAFEARFSYGGKIHSFDMTLYDRITANTFDRRIALNADGVLVSSPINAGQRIDQGVEAAFRGRIVKSLRYSLTGNLTSVTRDIGTIGSRRSDAQYRAKLQLDYTQGKAADPGFDQVTANLRYEGPARQFEFYRSDFVDADVTWTHRFTTRLSMVVSGFSLFDGVRYNSETRTPFILERRHDEQGGRSVRLSLNFQLSRAPQPQPPQPVAPVIPSAPGNA